MVQLGFSSRAPAPNPRGYWKTVVCSADGKKLVATDVVHFNTSTNTGVNWSLTSAPSNQWSAIASSSDGTKLVACNDYSIGTHLHLYNFLGLNWIPPSLLATLFGQRLHHQRMELNWQPAPIRATIYFSTNSGLTWSINSFPTYVSAMASTADGTKLFAAFNGGGISIGQLIVPAQNFSANVSGSGVTCNSQALQTVPMCYSLQQISVRRCLGSQSLQIRLTPAADGHSLIRIGANTHKDSTPLHNEPSGNSKNSTSPDKFHAATGTGFFITDDGYLISNYHVVKDATKVRLLTSAGLIDAKVVQVDAANDLALLKADGKFSPLPIVIQPVGAIGRHGGDGRFSRHRFARVRAQAGQGGNRVAVRRGG